MSASAFSYAQAARGRAVSQSSPQETSSPAPSTTDSQAKDDASTGATSVTAPSVASNSAEVRETDQTTQAEEGSTKQDSEVSSVVGSGSSTESATEQSAKVAQEDSTKTADAQTSSNEDKGPRSASRNPRSNDSVDGRKGRKGKKGRSSDKDTPSEQNQDEDAEKAKEAAKPLILTEALPPAVNPWAKRMESQKASPIAVSDGPIAGNESKQGTSQEEADVNDAAPNGINGQKKPVEASRPADQAPRRSGPRGSRASDKDEKSSTSLPPAADPTSWPEVKAAAAREQPARKTQDKVVDTSEKESQDEAGPTRKKTWEKLDIVHSVVFETQLPPLRGSKPRGGARGGREAGSMRGGAAGASAAPQPTASAVSDKATPAGSSTGPKPAATRPQEGSIPARSTSQSQPAHASKRASIDGAPREQRKPSVQGSTADQARDSSLEPSYVSLLTMRTAIILPPAE